MILPLVYHTALSVIWYYPWYIIPNVYETTELPWFALFVVSEKTIDYLTHFQPITDFYTPWKHQKTNGETLVVNELR